MYKTVLKDGLDEFVERKSRFIGYAFKVNSEEEALEKLEEIKKKHKDATHNCSAYIIGEDKLIQRYNDDGEPSGTAGVPMLEVLKKEDITNVLVVATRYFGGILLGAGGLVRAYTKTAKIAIDSACVVDIEKFYKLSIIYDYTYHGAIKNYLLNGNVKILDEEFTDKVKIFLYNKIGDEKIISDLTNITSANIAIKEIKQIELPTKNGEIIYRD